MEPAATRTVDLDRFMMVTALLAAPSLSGVSLARYAVGVEAFRSMLSPANIALMVLVSILIRRRRREADEVGMLRS